MNSPVQTQWIDIASPQGAFSGYLALPPAGSGPALVLFQEIFGVNPHIRGVAEQYALAGFVVLAPDMFWRQATKVELGYEGADQKRAYELMNSVTPDGLANDIQAGVATLRARPEASGRKLGAIGYCMGGRLTYMAAASGGIDAGVAYYGGGIQNQLELAPQVKCPLQFHYGALDDHIPASAVDAVRAAFEGKPADLYVYPGAGHGFNCWARGSYHPASAGLAHGRSLQFLAEQLF